MYNVISQANMIRVRQANMIMVIQVHVHVCMYSALNQTEMVYKVDWP